MSEHKHSPLPWHFGTPRMKTKIFANDKKRGDYTVLDIRGWGYFTGKGHGALGLSETEAMARMDANADFALLACNAHYELVEALKTCLVGEPNKDAKDGPCCSDYDEEHQCWMSTGCDCGNYDDAAHAQSWRDEMNAWNRQSHIRDLLVKVEGKS